MERGKETRTEQSAETELPAQVAGFLGLPHPAFPPAPKRRQDPSGSLQDAAAARGATRLGRASAAQALGTDPGRPARNAFRRETRPAPASRRRV